MKEVKGAHMKEEMQKELMVIYEREGALNPEAVVDTAKDEDNPLHPHFQWDDTLASHQYRLEQARKLIRVAVTVIPELSNKPVKQFVSITALRGSEQGSYIATVDILSDERKYEMALQDALRNLGRLRFQYTYLEELNPVWTAIDKAVNKLRRDEAA
jgi:hypothetical protein